MFSNGFNKITINYLDESIKFDQSKALRRPPKEKKKGGENFHSKNDIKGAIPRAQSANE
jgi:hypothetical protein